MAYQGNATVVIPVDTQMLRAVAAHDHLAPSTPLNFTLIASCFYSDPDVS